MGIGQADERLIGRAVFGMSAIVARAREAANANGVVVFAALLSVDQVLECNDVRGGKVEAAVSGGVIATAVAATIAASGAVPPVPPGASKIGVPALENDHRVGPVRHRCDAVRRRRRIVGHRRARRELHDVLRPERPDDRVVCRRSD